MSDVPVNDVSTMTGAVGEAPASVMGDPVNGRFGEFGGQFVPETLVPALDELERALEEAERDAHVLGARGERNILRAGTRGRDEARRAIGRALRGGLAREQEREVAAMKGLRANDDQRAPCGGHGGSNGAVVGDAAGGTVAVTAARGAGADGPPLPSAPLADNAANPPPHSITAPSTPSTINSSDVRR